METDVEKVHRKIEFYRRSLWRTVGVDVAAICQGELTAAEFELAELERRTDRRQDG
jgi:hypothetical protein